MQAQTNYAKPKIPPVINTEEYANRRLVKADSVRRRLCTHGSYFGDVPVKLPNGRLGWPDK
jgi:hypothetical protein